MSKGKAMELGFYDAEEASWVEYEAEIRLGITSPSAIVEHGAWFVTGIKPDKDLVTYSVHACSSSQCITFEEI